MKPETKAFVIVSCWLLLAAVIDSAMEVIFK